jgi:hypothetical protein
MLRNDSPPPQLGVPRARKRLPQPASIQHTKPPDEGALGPQFAARRNVVPDVADNVMVGERTVSRNGPAEGAMY